MPDQAPTAVITASSMTGKAPLVVRLSGALSTDDEGITEYTWSFPDQDIDPICCEQIEQEYDQSGEYTVCLTVRDCAGQCATDQCTISIENTAPIASCRFSNDAPTPSESILFDATASYDTDGKIVDVIWDFGDGTSLRGNPVSHAYGQTGTYLVQLTVVDNGGASAAISHTMIVHEYVQGGGCSGGSCSGIAL